MRSAGAWCVFAVTAPSLLPGRHHPATAVCCVQVAAMPEAQVRYMTDKIPMRRTGSLAEVADLVCFITSRACSFTTGARRAPSPSVGLRAYLPGF